MTNSGTKAKFEMSRPVSSEQWHGKKNQMGKRRILCDVLRLQKQKNIPSFPHKHNLHRLGVDLEISHLSQPFVLLSFVSDLAETLEMGMDVVLKMSVDRISNKQQALPQQIKCSHLSTGLTGSLLATEPDWSLFTVDRQIHTYKYVRTLSQRLRLQKTLYPEWRSYVEIHS